MKKSGRVIVLGIAGGSGSGKSWLAEHVRKHFKRDAVVVSQDWYYRDRSGLEESRKAKLNFDHPSAFETPLLLRQIQALQAGQAVETPRYDYATYRRLPETVTLEPAKLVIIEGLLVLHEERLRRVMDLSVFVDYPADLRLARRVRRDGAERGLPVNEVLRIYEHCARPMHERYVQPSSAFARWRWEPLHDKTFPRKLIHHLGRLLS
jgi:uridine kinase